MQHQTGIPFYRFRYLFASILSLAFLLLISALVTDIGSHSILNTKLPSRTSVVDSDTSYTPDAVTADVDNLLNDTKQDMLSTGIVLYKSCRSITKLTTQSTRDVAHDSVITMHDTGHGALIASSAIGRVNMLPFHIAGNAIMFTVRILGKIVRPITRLSMVSALLRPDDNKTVPVINEETSAAILAHLSMKQEQGVAKLQAAQVAANLGLDGSVVTGDPNHGGYPAKWDAPVAQDSMLDSWGMYNRECVSYTAWKVYQTFGYMPYWGGKGNANEWVGDAQAAGILTGSTPQVHSVAISMRGYYGHAMWVEAVSGNMIYVSQYNYDLNGQYSEMWVNGTSFTYIYFK